MKAVFIIFFTISNFYSFGQELDLNFYSKENKLYIIGEDHFEDDIEIQLSIIEYIKKNAQIDALIFEFPSEATQIFNEYVLTGNKKDEVDGICNLVSKSVSRKTKIILDYLKNHNQSNTHKIKVEGLDMLRFHKLKRQIKSLQLIFPELSNVNLPLTKKYVLDQRIRNYKRNKSSEIIDHLTSELEQNRSVFQQYLGQKMTCYEKCLNDLKFYYMDYSWRKSDSIREVFMSQNLIQIVDSNTLSIMICGAAHATFKENDSWFYGYPFTTMAATIEKKYPNQISSIITQYYEKKLLRIFPEFNLLNNPMEFYFKGKNKEYQIISGDELNMHPVAKERCNVVILKNNRYKK